LQFLQPSRGTARTATAMANSGGGVPVGMLNIGKMKKQMDKFKIRSKQEMEKVVGMDEGTFLDTLVSTQRERSLENRGSIPSSEDSCMQSPGTSMGCAANPCCSRVCTGDSPSAMSPISQGFGGPRDSVDPFPRESVDSSLLDDMEEATEWKAKSIFDDTAHEDDPDPAPFMFCLTVCDKDESHVNERRSKFVMNFCLGLSCLSCIIMFGYIILGYMFYINDFSSQCRWTVEGCESVEDVANAATTT